VCRRRAASRCSRIITCGSARSRRTRSRRKASRSRRSGFDETEVGEAKLLTITEITPAEGSALNAETIATQIGLEAGRPGLIDHEIFESIYHEGKLALLASWKDARSARTWFLVKPQTGTVRHRKVRVIRDYGMFERREAPQFYREIKKADAPPVAQALDQQVLDRQEIDHA